MRVNLKSDPEKYVEFKERWTYGDKAGVLQLTQQGIPLGVAMLHTVVTGRNFDTPADLADLDDSDGEVVVEAIATARNLQLKELSDPNSSRA